MKQIQENLGEEIDFFKDNQKYNVINGNDSSGAYTEEDPKQIQIGKQGQEKFGI